MASVTLALLALLSATPAARPSAEEVLRSQCHTWAADPKNPWATERAGTYVVVPDIETHYARAQAAGAKIERPLASTDYGAREYTARDCDGHLWSFGTYDPYAKS